MFGSSDPRPQAPALPDPLPAPPSFAANSGSRPAGNQSKIPGFGSTLMTGPQGVDSSNTNTLRKSLLGQ
jgi:hypothetical protein